MNDIPKILKSISDNTRYRIINLLLEHDYCVHALSNKLNISASAVSQHLNNLKKVNLVTGKKHGYYTHYHLNREKLNNTGLHLVNLSKKQKIANRKNKKWCDNDKK